MNQDLSVKAKTIKLLKGNIGEKLSNTGFGNNLLYWIQQINRTISKFKTMHQRHNNVKRQPLE